MRGEGGEGFVFGAGELDAEVDEDGTFTLELDSGERLVADKLLVAAGRTPNLDDLGLDTVGLDPGARTIDVDDRLRVRGTGEQGALWAIGDITGKGAFTHVAMYQSAIALRDLLGQDGPPASYHALPHATFTDPDGNLWLATSTPLAE